MALRVAGDPDADKVVIECLERALEKAKKGDIQGIFMVYHLRGGKTDYDYASVSGPDLMWSIKTAEHGLMKECEDAVEEP